MKILELRFKNLNSLHGEWVIDFTAAEYRYNGIFALTGPTGAGKSTILDAICLALYGATPRLGKITKSSNEIMSRQTGECYAEILFESQAGRFRCHWEQRRARKKADGNLQDQEHQIADDITGKPIETKKSLVGQVIEQKTGMDFERFSRSILLAQGSFDSFLKADIEQKSKILEQITGTEIYSDISRRVHERQREEREKLNILNAEISGIVILQPEQEEALKEAFTEKQKQQAALSQKVTDTVTAISWLNTIDELNKEILNLADEAAKLKLDSEAFKAERSRLKKANEAASLDGKHATLTALRKQQADDQTSKKIAEAALPEHESSVAAHAVAFEAAEQITLKAKQQLKTEAPLIHKVRSLDQMITELTKTVSDGADACAKQAAKIEAEKQARIKCLKKQIETEQTLSEVALYLQENVQDQWLISGLAGVEEQLDNLRIKQQEIAQQEVDIKEADAAVAATTIKQQQASKQCVLKKQDLKTASKNLQQAKQTLSELLGNKLLREYRTEKESMLREMVLLQKIEELKDHRTKLEDGKPCPLCGSVEHPFAEGHVPLPDKIEQKIESLSNLIDKADEQQATINKLEQAETNAYKNLYESEKLETDANNSKKAAEKKHTELKDTLNKLRTGLEVLMLAVSGKLKPLGIVEIEPSKVGKLLESLESRQTEWQNQVKHKTDIEKQLTPIDIEVRQLDVLIDSLLKELAEKQDNLQRLKQKLADTTDQRKRLYGDKKPEHEEIRLNRSITDAEETEKRARDLNSKLQQKLTSAKTHIESMQMRIEQTAPKLRKAESEFSAALISSGFADEKSFLDARLSHQQRESLSSRAKQLDHAVTELNAKQKERETRLAKEIAKQHTNKKLEELEPQLKAYEASFNQLRDAIAGLKHKLNENSLAKHQIGEKQSAIEAQNKECQRWQKLDSLIGSSDGKKYRNFAQGLTFELMVSHANRQLEKMTDRYLLIRDEKKPLELSVMDNYQAGEIRSTRNLSGGESFIVSLCLALGLSKMASKNVRVDSLFLDEGFGTLDDDSLNTALDTLATLQEEGKLIGVISHISDLQDRVSTQIKIRPKGGGRSQLTGPGCERIGSSQSSS